MMKDKLLFKIINIDFDHIKNLEFVQRFFVQRFPERKDIDDLENGFYIRIRYNNNEIISAELTHVDPTLPCIQLDEETLLTLLK